MNILLLLLSLAVISKTVHGQWIWETLLVNNIRRNNSVRAPREYFPISDLRAESMTCNTDTRHPNELTALTASPGDRLGFALWTNWVLHDAGPASLYLAKVPEGRTLQTWDGKGKHWFKIFEWGVSRYDTTTSLPPRTRFVYFEGEFKNELIGTIPLPTPPGDYLVRIEYLVLADPKRYTPNVFATMSCGHLRITGNGTGKPSPLVSIPGHLDPQEPGLTYDIFASEGTRPAYTMPGPALWRG